jgi:hypothetical protein
MNWKVERVELSEIARQKRQPNYGFVEQSIAGGTAYAIVGGKNTGYFIVGSVLSLTPGFVVELALPELAVADKYRALADEMTERSLGTLWFDSSDNDACDFAWRLGLAIRSGAPMFSASGLNQDVPLEGFTVTTADKGDQARVVELLSSPPLDAGGQTREATLENLNGGCVAVLKKDKDIVGAAVLTPLPGPYVALSTVVMETYSEQPAEIHDKAHRELELLFMNMMATEVAKRKLTLVYSMARQTPQGYLEAQSLRMKVVKQSFTATLQGLPPVFEPNFPEGTRVIV